MDLSLAPPSAALVAFADEVGGADAGPVVVVGGRTHWDVGGPPDPAAREVRAPVGVVEHEPAELIVRCGAGTTVAELAMQAEVDEHRPGRREAAGCALTGWLGHNRIHYSASRRRSLSS